MATLVDLGGLNLQVNDILVGSTAPGVAGTSIGGGSETPGTVSASTAVVVDSSKNITGFNNIGFAGYLNESATTGITAGTTRTRGGATALTTEINRVDTSTAPSAANLGDGVVLPATVANGRDIIVVNNTANTINVYAAGSDTINGVAGSTGVAQMANSSVLYVSGTTGTYTTEGLATGYASGLTTFSYKDNITAHAGGGQASAYAINTMIARFSTVASALDSAQLPTAVPGLEITVINAAAANTMNVYPVNGGSDTINGLAANTPIALPAGTIATFYCTVATVWHVVLTSLGTSVSARCMATGSRVPISNADGHSTTASTTTSYWCELPVYSPVTSTGVALMNAGTVAGNVQMWLVDSAGAAIANTASTAQSGTSAYQRVAWTAAQYLVPGTYYLVLQANNATATFFTHTFGNFGTTTQTGQTFGTFATTTPPTTFTTNVGPIASLY